MSAKQDGCLAQPLAGVPGAEHLTVRELIGQGGMGIVYKAHDARRDEIVALKVLHEDLCTHATFVSRFKREAASLAELSHPNIVKGYEVGGSDQVIYFTMEHVDGADLAHISAEQGPLDPLLILQVAIQAGRALSYAFSKGKIHRDIKPANLLLTSKGKVKLSDFGLIKGEDDPCLTGITPIMGTPYYMSPEIVSGCQDIDIRSDIYSLGTTLYHLITGSPPFAGQDMPVVMTRQITDTIEIPPHIRFPGGGQFRYILSKMLSKRRELRYQTPDELLADLAKIEVPSGATAAPMAPPALPKKSALTSSNKLFSAPTVEALRPRLDSVLEQFQVSSLKLTDNTTVTYSSGTVLFYEGDDSRDFYILNSGKCEVLRSGKRLAIIDEPGASFGEISAILGGRRTATIRAVTRTVCTIVPLEKFKTFLAKNPEVQQGVLEMALTRLKDLNERYVNAQNTVAKAKSGLLRMSRQMAFLSPTQLSDSVKAITDSLKATEE